jgi:hypothetical protein
LDQTYLVSGKRVSLRLWLKEKPQKKPARRRDHETVGYVQDGQAELVMEGQTIMDDSYIEAFRQSRAPPSFMVLFEDSAALISIGIALLGTWSATQFEWPALDGLASIFIGFVLAAVAAVLATETKSLLIGEAALPEVEESIKRLAAADPAIVQVNGVLTVHLAPNQILASASNLRTT